jgi:hypothetical protein
MEVIAVAAAEAKAGASQAGASQAAAWAAAQGARAGAGRIAAAARSTAAEGLQLVRVERMARQDARSMVRPLGMERRVERGVVEFWLVLAWWMLERATDGGPSGHITSGSIRKTPARID